MRLIHTSTLTLTEFHHPNVPAYTILSHTWTNEEISYQDLVSPERLPGKEAGYAKLDNGTRMAREDGYSYLWIDTCCIDKSNSSELSEAINSMFDWYAESDICYAYLSDVPHGFAPEFFKRSNWFTRGWTLQELLAPRKVLFLTRAWSKIDTKDVLAQEISRITRIPEPYLQGKDLDQASVAQRMSWAAERKTTRPEDLAYCLMGIFGVNMPLLYGEREAGAFKRLQLEILKEMDDTSIFAWSGRKSVLPAEMPASHPFPLLAYSPAFFRDSWNIISAEMPLVSGYLEGIRTPIVANNKGLHLSLPLLKGSEGLVRAVLGCTLEGKGDYRVAVWLKDISTHGGRYARVRAQDCEIINMTVIESNSAYESITTETKAFKKFSVRKTGTAAIIEPRTPAAIKKSHGPRLQDMLK